jgi:hypothetical protein
MFQLQLVLLAVLMQNPAPLSRSDFKIVGDKPPVKIEIKNNINNINRIQCIRNT